IWRRMLVVHWSVTIPPEERREFDEFVADLLTERAGILNWLIAGALDFLSNGLVVAEPIAQATAAYREDMDPIGRFVADCVRVAPGMRVGARAMYEAYVSWAKANAIYVRSETKFGIEVKKRFTRDDGRTRSYLDCELHDVPARPDDRREAPAPEDYS
ncbi:MAG TPA: primase-like DNA-binding domain-containing protein, partial [Roseiarcus sp.]|nr:primase-like DNA-binding domain-containing protein [Roseiarcus sp.]